MYDIIIIGNGPAGCSAAIYATRANKKVLVISKRNSNLLKAKEVENYYGFIDPINGEELYNNGILQAKRLGATFVDEEVVGLAYYDSYYVKTPSNEYNAKAVILATGTNRVAPRISNIKEYEGKGVSYCAVCDGFFYRKKKVAVLGNKAYALNEANELKHLASEVVILTNGEEVLFDDNSFKIDKRKITKLAGDGSLEKIVFEDNDELEVSGLFVALGTASSVDFALKLGAEVKNNKLVVNDKMQTNLPNLYACGDNTPGMLQVAKAVYEGAVAGTEASKNIK